MTLCPKCKSKKAKQVTYRGIKCLVCSSCGFDERNIYDESFGEKGSQKAKGRYSPYRTGGKSRTKR